MTCPRCAGLLLADPYDADTFRCALCGRRYQKRPPPPAPPPALPNGAWWLPHLVKYRKCRCGAVYRVHPNGQRKRCRPCQLASLAKKTREKRAKAGKLCTDCGRPIPTSCRSPRCADCRKARNKATRGGAFRGMAASKAAVMLEVITIG